MPCCCCCCIPIRSYSRTLWSPLSSLALCSSPRSPPLLDAAAAALLSSARRRTGESAGQTEQAAREDGWCVSRVDAYASKPNSQQGSRGGAGAYRGQSYVVVVVVFVSINEVARSLTLLPLLHLKPRPQPTPTSANPLFQTNLIVSLEQSQMPSIHPILNKRQGALSGVTSGASDAGKAG